MKKEVFLKLIDSKGFEKVENNSIFGDRTFETKFKSDGWMDGYSIKYILTFQPTYGIKFTLDKLSVGGFSGTQEIKQRLFDGSISTEEDFENVLRYINFC